MATIREATPADLPVILDIHNEAILNTTAIWDETPVDLADRVRWYEKLVTAGYPVLVAETGGAVAGYASYGPFRPRSSYRHTVENSVYVHRDHRRRGIARELLIALLGHAYDSPDVHVVLALIESGNTVSIELHEDLGFEQTSHLAEVGRKFDRWLDLTILRCPVG
ncbi:GNAT family N-acetyltransferase [Aeromicrobium duanguangcaii]|uniref:GNAT family N-acetyltransferase n=1 Tax=Aeromicrobium duanguangcaii TaxID=2968086 RepID=A0ABY5KKB0_9ACTN|nr:GNAT family N-acetyltransferase [Aeromicrobium duanguangcaii]MCD9153312.1 N-acetyltransferase family protein [Aeromicrobium duanguangcaii]MCL3836696.1 N-acetyltransferase family protein [Aeromicrobium duanguangcaii]UUI69592.1 GNAT family N-acetyltransferase [Aeromicrobium duanguangcaii]